MPPEKLFSGGISSLLLLFNLIVFSRPREGGDLQNVIKEFCEHFAYCTIFRKAILKLPMETKDGWQKVWQDDNPFEKT